MNKTKPNFTKLRMGLNCNLLSHYRILNYKVQNFAMVLSSLDIHRINGSRMTLVFFGRGMGRSVAQS